LRDGPDEESSEKSECQCVNDGENRFRHCGVAIEKGLGRRVPSS
jgi:hypothetical protein